MAPTQQQNQQPGNQSGGNQAGNQGGNEQRSEGLLPAGKDDDGRDDGRFGVAEEVNLDQQSDKLRKVGQLPDTKPADDQLPDPAQQSDG